MKIGIIGSGEIARQLSLSGISLGFEFHCLGKKDECAAEVVKTITEIDLDNTKDVVSWAKQFDILTFEKENIPLNLIKELLHQINIYPSAKAISICQDRLCEKTFLQEHGIATANFVNIDSLKSLQDAVAKYGLPAILKKRKYIDERENLVITSQDDIVKAWDIIENSSCGFIYERYIGFDYEVSQICTVDIKGNIAFYPLSKNIYKNGMITEVEVPFNNSLLLEKSQQIATQIIKDVEMVGTLTIEFFVKDNDLIVKKIHPCLHESGNWSIDASLTSQYENHIRAISGLLLGDVSTCNAVMLNCIGMMPTTKDLSALDRVKIHVYNKKFCKESRVGHLNIRINDETDKYQLLQAKKLIALCESI
ncbi:MAG: 5-(carboxyamino)imidazole ribonucleotide synthase [Francisella sp.]